jgi:hypothetical protein
MHAFGKMGNFSFFIQQFRAKSAFRSFNSTINFSPSIGWGIKTKELKKSFHGSLRDIYLLKNTFFFSRAFYK